MRVRVRACVRVSWASLQWEGEKLSWEAGVGVSPEKLPDYVDYKEPGDDGEVC